MQTEEDHNYSYQDTGSGPLQRALAGAIWNVTPIKPLATTTPIVTLVQVGTPDLVEVEMEEDPRYGINVICSISPANQILADPAVLPDLLIRKLAVPA